MAARTLWGLLTLLAPRAWAHMPVFDVSHDPAAPVELGDATADSWAACSELSVGRPAYYHFTAGSSRSLDTDRFWFGLYTPGCTKDCTDSPAVITAVILGMPGDASCEPWEGWGDVALITAANGTGAACDYHGRPVSSGNTTGARNCLQLTAPAVHRGRPQQVYEPFTPTVFSARGSCISDYPPTVTDYTMVVNVTDAAGETRDIHVCAGLGKAEKSVFSPESILLSGFITWQVQAWGRWPVIALISPIAVSAIGALAWTRRLSSAATSDKLSLAASVLIASSVMGGLAQTTWAVGIVWPSDGTDVLWTVALRVALPAVGLYFVAESYDRHDRAIGTLLLGAALAMVAGAGFIAGPTLAAIAAIARRQRHVCRVCKRWLMADPMARLVPDRRYSFFV